MQISTLKEKLNPKFEELVDEIPTINFGGCGVFAEFLYHFLTAHGFKPKMYVLCYDTELMNRCLSSGKRSNNSIGLNHVYLKIGKYYADAYGIVDSFDTLCENNCYSGSKDTEEYALEMPVKVCSDWNKVSSYWNNRFNRTQNIPVLKVFFETLTLA